MAVAARTTISAVPAERINTHAAQNVHHGSHIFEAAMFVPMPEGLALALSACCVAHLGTFRLHL